MPFNFLFSFFIRPIELVFEFIFSTVFKLTGNVGVSVISIGIIMNILHAAGKSLSFSGSDIFACLSVGGDN